MKPSKQSFDINRRVLLATAALLPIPALLTKPALAQETRSQLASWNDGPAKQAIIDFVRATTDPSTPKFVPPQERIAAFDQDGTLWVEHPMYTFMTYCFERVPILVKAKPRLKDVEPFKTVLSGNREEMAKLTTPELEKILAAALTGMTVEEFNSEVTNWLETARHPRWNRPYTELVYQPMLEVLRFLRTNGFKTYIVTGGGQDFARMGSEKMYGIPPEQVVGTASGTKYEYDKDGRPTLLKEPNLRRPYSAFCFQKYRRRTRRRVRASIRFSKRAPSSDSPLARPIPPKDVRHVPISHLRATQAVSSPPP